MGFRGGRADIFPQASTPPTYRCKFTVSKKRKEKKEKALNSAPAFSIQPRILYPSL